MHRSGAGIWGVQLLYSIVMLKSSYSLYRSKGFSNEEVQRQAATAVASSSAGSAVGSALFSAAV